MHSLLQANQLRWLIDLYADRFTGHARSDYMSTLLQANQLKQLINFYSHRLTGHERSD
jgi:hypothetical protein